MKFIIILLFICSQVLPALAEKRFEPWDSKVAVGDERRGLHVFPCNGSGLKLKRADSFRSVYNGGQAGAYALIRFFQIVISPQDGPNCRFAPTCSAYGKQAVERYGAFLGGMLAGDRLLRCNPSNPGGFDPVPKNIFHDHK